MLICPFFTNVLADGESNSIPWENIEGLLVIYRIALYEISMYSSYTKRLDLLQAQDNL